MRTVTVQQRRRAMVYRHHLAGDASDPEAVTPAMIALHATDPASVYLSVLARSTDSTLTAVSEAMYERRNLVRWMAMRRTLFVFAREDVPIVQAAVSTPVAAKLRKALISRLRRNGSEPPIDGDIGRWLAELEERVDRSLARHGTATGAQLADDEPLLKTLILAGAPSDRPQNVTTSLLTLIDTAMAQRDLARRWLARFGPATTDDLQWWTGWNQTTVRRALESLAIEEVDLHGQPGISLVSADDNVADDAVVEPTATLLPALDPTPMG